MNVSGGTTGGAIAVNGAGLTTLTINSTGADNTVGAVSTTGTPTTTTINAAKAFTTTGLTVGTNATADQALVISGAATNVAASATAAATAAVVLGALDADLDSVNASGLTAGGVSATLSATVAATFTGGAGADTVTTSTTGQTGVVNAGNGTDTLVLANTVDIDTTTEGAKYTGFEVLQVQDAVTADLDNFTGSTITSVNLNDGAGTTIVNNLSAAQAAAINVVAYNGAATIGVKNAGDVGQLDTVTLNFNDGDTTASEAYGTALEASIAGVETLNLVLTDDAAVTLAAATNAALNKVVVTGGGDLTLITGDTAGANFLIDASASTGTTNITAAAFATNGVQIKGSATKANTITGSGQSDIIVGGTAIDTVTNTAGTDTLNLGSDAAADIFNIAVVTGRTTITNFDVATTTTTEDLINVSANTLDGAEVAITAAAAQALIGSDRTIVIAQTVGAAGALATGGSATLVAADFTATTLTNVAAYLSERFTGDNDTLADETALVVVNNGTNTYLYAYADSTTANTTIDAGELTLVGVVNAAVLNAGDIFQTV